MLGALFFAIESFPPYSLAVDARVVVLTLFIESFFFKAAGYSQFLQVCNDDEPGASTHQFRFAAGRPKQALWRSALFQLVGTVFFNVNTLNPLVCGFTTSMRKN